MTESKRWKRTKNYYRKAFDLTKTVNRRIVFAALDEIDELENFIKSFD